MRLIDADALIEKLKSLYEDEWNQNVCTTWANAFEDCEELVDAQPTADVPQWIPCSERLPKGDEIVLVNTLPIAPYQIILATAKDVRKYYTEGAVDAWMQLPEPWKEEENEQVH